MSPMRRICCSRSSAGLPQTCTVASVPKPNQLFFSCAFTRSEISNRSPDAATFARCTVTPTGPEPSSGNERPLSCASRIRFTSVNGTSIGTPILTRPCVSGGTISSLAGNGQLGLFSFAMMRLSACTPRVSVSASASTRGCAANARVGRNSSQRLGSPVVPPPSGIERHIFAHSLRATFSRKGSARSRVCRAAICSLTALSSSGFTSFDTLSLIPEIETALSPIDTWPVRLGSSRQLVAIDGRAVTATLPRKSARWSSALPVKPSTLRPRLSLSRLVILPPRPAACEPTCPVTRNAPFRLVARCRPLASPFTASGDRATVKPISAFESALLSGLSGLPARSRGAARSSISRIAGSATATGAMMTEERVTGGSGGTSASAGRRSGSRASRGQK